MTAGIGLHRELGTREPARSLIDRDAAFVKHLTPVKSTTRLNSSDRWKIELAKFEPCLETGQTVISLRGTHTANLGRTAYTLHSLTSRCLDRTSSNVDALLLQDIGGPYAAFGSPVTSISTASIGEDILIFASAQDRASPGNVFSTRLMPSTALPPHHQQDDNDDDKTLSPYQMTTSSYATLGTLPHTSLYSTSIAPTPTPHRVAVSGTLGVWTLDLDCRPLDRLSITRPDYSEPEDDETRAVDWLDPHTVAAGSETVYLWDQRSGGASQRFRCKGRVTGICDPERGSGGGGGGQTLLATTNHAIALFDVRYVSKSRPLLSWRHQHEGPQISLTSDGRGLFAAVDRDGWVHVYSMRTGGEVARLGRQGRGALGNLRWWEDGAGRVGLKGLMGGGGVVGWEWSGRDD